MIASPFPPSFSRLPPVGLTLAAALVAHVLLWPFQGNDVGQFLIPWFDHIRSSGIPAAFATPFSNYMPAYLYLMAAFSPLATVLPVVTVIKLLSVAGTAMLAGASWRLLRALGVRDAPRGAAIVFILPTTLINAPMLAQCDAIWTAACIMAVAMTIERRHRAMLAWFGLAVAIKLQAAFLGPFVVAMLINRRVPLRVWAIAPLVGVATLIPAWAAGWPIADLLTIYTRQSATFDALSLCAPNIWAIVQVFPSDLALGGLALASAIGGSAVYIAWFSSRSVPPRLLLGVALLAPLMVAGLLPRMHERFFFLADILALMYALAARDRASWTVAALVQTGSTLALMGYLSDSGGPALVGAIAMIAATIRVARPLIVPIANDTLRMRPA